MAGSHREDRNRDGVARVAPEELRRGTPKAGGRPQGPRGYSPYTEAPRRGQKAGEEPANNAKGPQSPRRGYTKNTRTGWVLRAPSKEPSKEPSPKGYTGTARLWKRLKARRYALSQEEEIAPEGYPLGGNHR